MIMIIIIVFKHSSDYLIITILKFQLTVYNLRHLTLQERSWFFT